MSKSFHSELYTHNFQRMKEKVFQQNCDYNAKFERCDFERKKFENFKCVIQNLWQSQRKLKTRMHSEIEMNEPKWKNAVCIDTNDQHTVENQMN